jgi:hypothetical protein
MSPEQRRPILGEHGIWRWSGERWVEVQNRFRDGKAPFDPNNIVGVRIRGDRVGQNLVFPLEMVIGTGGTPHRVGVRLASGAPLDGYCICECQGGEWGPVENYCGEGCAPSCGAALDPEPSCTDGETEVGGCTCDSEESFEATPKSVS